MLKEQKENSNLKGMSDLDKELKDLDTSEIDDFKELGLEKPTYSKKDIKKTKKVREKKLTKDSKNKSKQKTKKPKTKKPKKKTQKIDLDYINMILAKRATENIKVPILKHID